MSQEQKAYRLAVACCEANLAMVKLFLQEGVRVNSQSSVPRDFQGQEYNFLVTPIFWACMYGRIDVVKELVKVAICDKRHYTDGRPFIQDAIYIGRGMTRLFSDTVVTKNIERHQAIGNEEMAKLYEDILIILKGLKEKRLTCPEMRYFGSRLGVFGSFAELFIHGSEQCLNPVDPDPVAEEVPVCAAAAAAEVMEQSDAESDMEEDYEDGME